MLLEAKGTDKLRRQEMVQDNRKRTVIEQVFEGNDKFK